MYDVYGSDVFLLLPLEWHVLVLHMELFAGVNGTSAECLPQVDDDRVFSFVLDVVTRTSNLGSSAPLASLREQVERTTGQNESTLILRQRMLDRYSKFGSSTLLLHQQVYVSAAATVLQHVV